MPARAASRLLEAAAFSVGSGLVTIILGVVEVARKQCSARRQSRKKINIADLKEGSLRISILFIMQRWEFIKENKKSKNKSNTLSTKKATKKKRKIDNGQEKKKTRF